MIGDIGQVAEDLVEYGIAIEDTFKDAASCVIGAGMEPARRAQAEAHNLYSNEQVVTRHCFELLGHSKLSGEQMRQVAQTQRIASTYHVIVDHVRQLAALSLSMAALPNFDLHHDCPACAYFLTALVHQTFVGLRGSVIVANTRDPERAVRLLGEMSVIQRHFAALERYAHEAIGNASNALGFQYALLIGKQMREIGSQISTLCRYILQPPVQTMGAIS